MNSITALESRQWVRRFVVEMREVLIKGESHILQAAKEGGEASTPDLTIRPFPLRKGPTNAELVGKVLKKKPEIAMQLFRQALDEIEAEADSELRRNSDGELLDYHFPTDRTHPFRATVKGEEVPFLLTWETVIDGRHFITLYTRDAR